ncbi:MAG TPA: ABC transporter permease [Spongiibacteraceae bacterium]|nr:ABC transporter permease [Spongiibacteraceae bacterium]
MDNADIAEFTLRATADCAEMELRGAWHGDRALPSFASMREAFAQQPTNCWRVIPGENFTWDSACMTRLFLCARYCADHNIALDISALPDGIRKLLAVATAVKPQAHLVAKPSLRDQWRAAGATLHSEISDFLGFVGGVTLAFLNWLRGRANMRARDFWYFFEQCGAQALGIVALISVLVGMILAYLGSVQLRQFGAEVYIANLVALGAVREMGALMTAVIMAGRTGAAYAAQLGAMQANEEIDAITTLGISPLEYLVLPRMLALIIAMPLLCIFSDVLCLVGGALVATGMDVSSIAFIHQARGAVGFDDIASGIIKGFVFAILIGTAGCQAGMRSGRSADAVGRATTRAVVNAIVYLVIADAALNIAYDRLNF